MFTEAGTQYAIACAELRELKKQLNVKRSNTPQEEEEEEEDRDQDQCTTIGPKGPTRGERDCTSATRCRQGRNRNRRLGKSKSQTKGAQAGDAHGATEKGAKRSQVETERNEWQERPFRSKHKVNKAKHSIGVGRKTDTLTKPK